MTKKSNNVSETISPPSILQDATASSAELGLNDHVNQIRQKKSMRSLGCKNTKSYIWISHGASIIKSRSILPDGNSSPGMLAFGSFVQRQ